MTALAVDRNTPERAGQNFQGPCVASDIIYKGSLVCRDSSGNIGPVTATTGLIGIGRSESYVDNSAGSAGDLNVNYRSGVFRWANGDSITKSSIGDTAYGFDDQTVKKTSTGLSPVGIIVDVDADGVWVDTNPGDVLASTGLLAANNLSDVGTVATAIENLGLGPTDSPTFDALTLTGTLGGVAANLSGALNVTLVTDSTSTTTGAIKTAGGLGVAKALFADSVTSAKKIVSVGASQGVGYATGAGGAVTQITDRTTGVTMVPNPCMSGAITTHNASLAAEVSADFIVTNSGCALGDVVVVSIRSGSNGGNTAVSVTTVTAGTFTIKVSNNNAAGGTAETGAIIINFAIIKAVSA